MIPVVVGSNPIGHPKFESSMKFRFYILAAFSGVIFGTNSKERALELAEDERNYVIDVESNMWMTYDGVVEEVTDLDSEADTD